MRESDMSAIRNNDLDFVKVIFARLTPRAKVSVAYNLETSLQANIRVRNFDAEGKPYKVGNFDLLLMLERYEKHGVDRGDEMTRLELLQAGCIPVAPPVSTGQGIPQADPFAPPEGLPDQGRFAPCQKSK